MNFFKQLLPNETPPFIAEQGEVMVVRERILQFMLLTFSALATLALVYVGFSAVQQQRYFILVLYGVMYFFLLLTTLFRSLPYTLRCYITIFLMFGLGISRLFESGQVGEVAMFLVCVVTLNAIYFNYRNIFASLVVGLVVTVVISEYPFLANVLHLPGIDRLQHGSDTVIIGLNFLVVSAASAGAIALVVSGMKENLSSRIELVKNYELQNSMIEVRIDDRTRAINKRLDQHKKAAALIQMMNLIDNDQELINRIVEPLREQFDLYYVGIFLLDSTGQTAILEAGTGEAGRKMLSENHRLTVGGNSMIGWTIANHKARIALDVGREAVRFSNPNLPLTRTELALPLLFPHSTGEIALGAVTVQSELPNAFGEEDLAILQEIVSNLAIDLYKVRLFRETMRNLEEIRVLNRDYLQRAWTEALETTGDLSYDFKNPTSQADQAYQEITLPLTLRNEVIGYITVEAPQAQLTADESSFVDNITTQTAIALENARLLQETERRAIQEQRLNALTARFSRAQNIDDILRAAAQELGQLPTVSEVSVHLSAGAVTAQADDPRLEAA